MQKIVPPLHGHLAGRGSEGRVCAKTNPHNPSTPLRVASQVNVNPGDSLAALLALYA